MTLLRSKHLRGLISSDATFSRQAPKDKVTVNQPILQNDLQVNRIRTVFTFLKNQPELELVLCCSRTLSSPTVQARIQDLLHGDLDWNLAFKISQQHGVTQLLYRTLQTFQPQQVPSAVLSYLNFLCRKSVLRSLQLSNELVKVLNLLAKHNILAIPFKGSVLSILAYQNLTLRQFGDLDILIDKQDLEAARNLLAERGYTPASLTETQKRDLALHGAELTFVHLERHIAVDLHWQIAPSYFPFEISLPEWKSRLQPVSLCGEEVLTFSLEDTLLHLCVHGATHQWIRLEWLCDIAGLIQAHRDEIQWERLIQQSAAVGCERILLLNCLMAVELLGLQLPMLLLQKIEADLSLRPLANTIYPLLFGQSEEEPLWLKMRPRERIVSFFAFIRMREKFGDQIRHLLHILNRSGWFKPTQSDYGLIRLPKGLSFLYWFIRPLRILHQYGTSLMKELVT
jgi:Uncharacterised nucleotidyltransferase